MPVGYDIVKNIGKCLKCGDIIESKHVHHYKSCSCGSNAVDGGMEYLRRCGDFDFFEELSELREWTAEKIANYRSKQIGLYEWHTEEYIDRIISMGLEDYERYAKKFGNHN